MPLSKAKYLLFSANELFENKTININNMNFLIIDGAQDKIIFFSSFNNNYYPVVKFLNGVEKEIEPISWQFDFNDRS